MDTKRNRRKERKIKTNSQQKAKKYKQIISKNQLLYLEGNRQIQNWIKT